MNWDQNLPVFTLDLSFETEEEGCVDFLRVLLPEEVTGGGVVPLCEPRSEIVLRKGKL